MAKNSHLLISGCIISRGPTSSTMVDIKNYVSIKGEGEGFEVADANVIYTLCKFSDGGEGREGLKNLQNLAEVICKWSLALVVQEITHFT